MNTSQSQSVPGAGHQPGFIRGLFGGLAPRERNWLVAIAALYFLFRLCFLRGYGMFNDEAIYCHWAKQIDGSLASWLQPLSDGKHPPLIWLIALAQAVIPEPLLAGRLVAALFGFGALLGVFALGRALFDTPVALLAAGLYLIHPLSIVHDRLALFDTPLTAFSLWGLALLFWIARHRRLDAARALGCSLLCAGALAMKTTGIQLTLFALLAIPLYFPLREWRRSLAGALLIVSLPLFAMILLSLLRRLAGLGSYSLFTYFLYRPAELLTIPAPQWRFVGLAAYYYYTYYWGYIPGILTIWGLWRLGAVGRWKDVVLLCVWCFLPLAFYLVFAKSGSSRYFLPNVTPMLAPAAAGFVALWRRVERLALGAGPRIRSILHAFRLPVGACCFWLFLKFSFLSLFAPASTPFVLLDSWQYVSSWAAGTYFHELRDVLGAETAATRSNLILHRHLGLLPDGLALYAPESDRVKHSYVNEWSLAQLQAALAPERRNLLVLDGSTPVGEEFHRQLRAEVGFRLIAVLVNPAPSYDRCYVYRQDSPVD